MALLPHRRRLRSLAAVALLVAGCADPDATVVVYTSLDAEVVAWAGTAFRDAHPRMRARFVAVSDDEAVARLTAERAAPEADVWWGAPSWRLAQGAGAGILERTDPTWAGDVPAEMRDPELRWLGHLTDPLVLAFAGDEVSRSRAPRDWGDLLHPRWSGEILIPEPGSDPALTALLVQHHWEAHAAYGDAGQGMDWWARLDAWRRGYTPDGAEALRRLRSGDGLLAIVSLSEAEAARAAGGVEYRVPESETPLLVRGVARVADGPHPEVARAFLEWLGSAEARAGLARVGSWIPAAGLPAERPAWAGRVEPALRAVTVPADSVAGEVDGWVAVWRDAVRGRAATLF